MCICVCMYVRSSHKCAHASQNCQLQSMFERHARCVLKNTKRKEDARKKHQRLLLCEQATHLSGYAWQSEQQRLPEQRLASKPTLMAVNKYSDWQLGASRMLCHLTYSSVAAPRTRTQTHTHTRAAYALHKHEWAQTHPHLGAVHWRLTSPPPPNTRTASAQRPQLPTHITNNCHLCLLTDWIAWIAWITHTTRLPQRPWTSLSLCPTAVGATVHLIQQFILLLKCVCEILCHLSFQWHWLKLY